MANGKWKTSWNKEEIIKRKHKVCAFCSVAFCFRYIRHSKKIFCSRICINKAISERLRGNKLRLGISYPSPIKGMKVGDKYRKKKLYLPKNCLYCNKEFFSYPSEGKKYCSMSCAGFVNARKGELNSRWKGGLTRLYDQIHHSALYKAWRMLILKRDDYSCQFCKKRGGRLEVDHIKPFSLIIQENNIKNFDDAIRCKELWDFDNARTLCKDCHKTTDTYMNGAIKYLQKLK